MRRSGSIIRRGLRAASILVLATVGLLQPTTGTAFAVTAVNMYRFYDVSSGAHFYTATDSEWWTTTNNLSDTHRFDGIAWTMDAASPEATRPLHRFYNVVNGSHFYTASDAEKASVIANLPSVYRYEGIASKVASSAAGGMSVIHRFYNLRTGTHFYTASDAEKDSVIAALSETYRYDGIAFYVPTAPAAREIGSEFAAVKAKAVKFSKSGQVDLKGVVDGVFSGIDGLTEYRDRTTGDEYLWNLAGGYIGGYYRKTTSEGRTGGTPISETTARQIAQTWAGRCYDGGSLDGMTVEAHFHLRNPTYGLCEWDVEFRRSVGGIPTFDIFRVTVDGVSGEVVSVSQDCAPLTESLEPTISEAEAISIGASELGVAEADCTAALQVLRKPTGEQLLVWRIGFDISTPESHSTGEAAIDAHDGSVIMSAKCG